MEILILGSGNCNERRFRYKEQPTHFTDEENITRVDMDPNCGADIVMEYDGGALPFDDDTFDEIHAYDSLEHWGTQGDWKGYFDEFAEYHRILKDKGKMYIIVPNTTDLFTDPGHRRFFSQNHFFMLMQDFYDQCKETNTPCTDYRFYWKKNFRVAVMRSSDHHFAVILEKA